MEAKLTRCGKFIALGAVAGSALLLAACQSDGGKTGPLSTTSQAPAPAVQYPEPDSGNLRAYLELARKNIQLQKATILADNMMFTEAEAAAFWPIHREYEAELVQVNDRKLDLIRKFLPQASAMTDDEARGLAKMAFSVEEERTDLKRKYFSRFQKVIPAAKAARFFQIENQLNMLIDLRIAAALPLIK